MNPVTLIKSVVQAIKTIEAVFPDSTGKEKLDAALALITSAGETVAAMLPSITALITTIVSIYNLVGTFTKKAA